MDKERLAKIQKEIRDLQFEVGNCQRNITKLKEEMIKIVLNSRHPWLYLSVNLNKLNYAINRNQV